MEEAASGTEQAVQALEAIGWPREQAKLAASGRAIPDVPEDQVAVRAYLADFALREGEEFEVAGIRYRVNHFSALDGGRWNLCPKQVRLDRIPADDRERLGTDQALAIYYADHVLARGQRFVIRGVGYQVVKVNVRKRRLVARAVGVLAEKLDELRKEVIDA